VEVKQSRNLILTKTIFVVREITIILFICKATTKLYGLKRGTAHMKMKLRDVFPTIPGYIQKDRLLHAKW
jgi:hypothetical protein